MQVSGLQHQFPGAHAAPREPGEALGLLVLPPRGVRIRQIPLFLKVPPSPPCQLGPVLGLSPILGDCISHKYFAAPGWLPGGKAGSGSPGRSRGAAWPEVVGRSWPLAFIPVFSQTSPGLSSHQPLVPINPAIVTSLGHCLLVCWKPSLHCGAPGLSSQCLEAETDPRTRALWPQLLQVSQVLTCSLHWPHLPSL